MEGKANIRIGLIALAVLFLDQLTKAIVLQYLDFATEKVILAGFFKFVHWQNTGAAWSLFRDRNGLLAIVALVAVVVLFLSRRHFDYHTRMGQVALGFMFGGIVGNLVDRVFRGHVIDFVYFYLERRGGTGGEIGFPAFNVADASICTGVGLLFLMSWRQAREEAEQNKTSEVPAKPAKSGSSTSA